MDLLFPSGFFSEFIFLNDLNVEQTFCTTQQLGKVVQKRPKLAVIVVGI